jgi:hypothetical protein
MADVEGTPRTSRITEDARLELWTRGTLESDGICEKEMNSRGVSVAERHGTCDEEKTTQMNRRRSRLKEQTRARGRTRHNNQKEAERG